MGSEKPNPQIRKPPEDDQKAAFIQGDGTSEESENQTSSNSDVQTSERKQTTVYLDADVKRKLKAFCTLEDREMSAFVNDLVAGKLEDWTPEI